MRLFFSLILLGGATVASAGEYQKELHCLAMNVYHEARGEPIEGQLAVALVTMNRVRHERYPDSVCRVVWQPRQFSWTRDGRSDRPTDEQAWRKAQEIAAFVFHRYEKLHATTNGALDVTKGAIYYFAPKKVNPHWARYKVVTREIGGHVFLKEIEESS